MANMEANLLADTYDMAYGLVRFYQSKLKEADPFKQWEVNGNRLNSIAWITAHLCWSEEFLLLRAIGGKPTGINWLEHYEFGSEGSLHEDGLEMKQLLDARKTIHEAAMAHVRSLTAEDLAKDNLFGIEFGSGKSVKAVIQHAIRHEGTHAGHLGWLCKINGNKTV